jgi:hypothetical protein
LEGTAEAREAGLDVRFAAFSASTLALISEWGTERMRHAKSVKVSKVPESLGDDEGSIFIAADYHHRLQLPTACIL